MTTMKWQTTIPTREQIEAHRARGGAWSSLFDGDDEAAHYDDAADVAELFGGSTDAATVERVRRGRVAADWGRS